MRTPVALFVFNRPDTTREVFARIREARPERLLIVADGPRPHRPDDGPLCEEVRRVVSQVDWPCEVHANVSTRNLGCGLRMSTGLDWVFRNVDEAIILEDDCVPSPEFFEFCTGMLERYRDDDRIGIITGSNYFTGEVPVDDDYLFCRYSIIWGWATWRRTWRHYDFTMSTLPDGLRRDLFSDLFDEPRLADFWRRTFVDAHQGKVDTWDYQLSYAMMEQSLLHIVPAVNLISNIGCGRADATHTQGDLAVGGTPIGTLPRPLRHPRRMVRHRRYERLLEDRVFMIPRPPEGAADGTFQTALAAFQAGRVAEAAEAARRTLVLRPDHAEAQHMLGLIGLRAGAHGPAVDRLRRAVAIAPGVWSYLNNLGAALRAAGDTPGARAALRQAVALAPNNATLRGNLAVVLGQPD